MEDLYLKVMLTNLKKLNGLEQLELIKEFMLYVMEYLLNYK
jgi:hypothetical protein